MAEEGAVKVCVRVRPLIQREKNKEQADSVPLCWKAEGNGILQIDGVKSFNFDRVFHSGENTDKVYHEMAVPIINSAIQGYNGTIFAYGQTSSGKTYTMMGTNTSCGIIPQAIHDVFKVINEIPNREFLLRVSYMEIYNETVTDLLCDDRKKKPLEIREDMNRNVYVADLTEELVVLPQNVMDWIKKGEKNRHYGETKMNERSSRSHTIFRMIVESRERTGPANSENCDGAVMVSHLNLVDLAGSERASQTGAEGLRLKEGCNINRSLFILGQVIKKLSDDQAGGFINYRDSKLTRILQNSLGGNAKTVIICTITPVSFDETLSTLQFASAAKNMKNTPHVNEVLDDEALLKRYRKEILDLKKQLEELETSSETRAKAMAADERAQLLEEIKLLQIEKEERTRNLTKIVVIPSSHVSHEDLRAKRKRRVTWAPGKLANSLSSTDDFGIGVNISHIPKRTKFSALQSLPEMDDSDVSEFDELSRTVDEGLSDIDWNPAIQMFQRERLFSCQNILNDTSQGLKHQSSLSLSLEISPPKKELELKVESMENQLTILLQERSAEIEQKDALLMENSNLQQRIISKEEENSEIVKRLEMTIAELEQKLLAGNETKTSDCDPSASPDQSMEKQCCDAFGEQSILEEQIPAMEDALHDDHVEASEATAELLSKHAEEKMVLEHKIMDLEDMIERMTSVQRRDSETQKCNEDFQESVQICEALILEKENAFCELNIMREHFDSVVLENERLKHEINDLKVQLNEKKELSEFEMLEKEAQKDQEMQLMHDIAELKEIVENADVYNRKIELDLEAKSNELGAKTKLLKEQENQVAELEKLVEKLQKKVRNIDLSVSMGSTEKFCEEINQLKQSHIDAETVTKDAQKESAFLRSENLDLKEKMTELSNTYGQMEKEVKLYKGQLESEKARFKKMQVDLQKELQYAFNENTKLNSLLDGKVPKDLVSRLELERDLTDMKKQLDKVLEERSDLQKEVDVLSDYKMLPSKVERLKKQVCEISEELCGITAEKNEINLMLTDKEFKIKILSDELGKTKEDLTSAQPKYDQVQKEYLELKQHFDAVQEEHRLKINEVNRKQEFTRDAVCETTLEETGESSKEFQHLSDKILAIEQEKQQIQLTLEAVQSERDQLKTDLEENIEMSIQVQEELRNSIEDHKRKAELIENLKSQIQAWGEMKDSTDNSEDDRMKLSSLAEELEQKTQEKERIALEKTELQQILTSEVQLLEERLKSCETALKDVENEKHEVVQQLEKLQEAATAFTLEKCELLQMQENLKEERDQLKQDLQINITQKSDLQERMSSEMQQLEEKLKASETALKAKDEKCEGLNPLQNLKKAASAITEDEPELQLMQESLKAERDQLKADVQRTIEQKTEQQDRFTSGMQQLEEQLKTSEIALKAVEDEKCDVVQQLHNLKKSAEAFTPGPEFQLVQDSIKAERDQLKEDVEKKIEQLSCLSGELQRKTLEKEHILLEKAELQERFTSEVQQLEEKLKIGDIAVKTLEGETCKIMQQLQDLQAATTAFTQEKHELQQMLDILKTERDQLRDDVQKNIEQLSLTEELKKTQEKEHILEKTELQQRLLSEMQQLEDQLKVSDTALKILKGEKDSIVQQFRDLQEATAAFTQEKHELQQMQDSLKAERDQLKEALEKNIEQLSALMEELKQTKNEKEQVLLEKMELEQRLSCAMKQLEERLNASESSLETVEREKCAAVQKLEELQKSADDLTKEKIVLEQTHGTVRVERDQLIEDVQKYLKQSIETEDALRVSQEELEEQKRQADELRKQISSYSSNIQENSVVIPSVLSVEEKMSFFIEGLQNKAEEKEPVLDEKKELEIRLTAEMQQLEERLKASASLLEMVEAEKREAVQSLHELQEGVAALTQDKNELQQMQESLQMERDRFSEDMQKHLKQISSLTEELQQKTDEKEQALNEKRELEQRLSSEMKELAESLKASESTWETLKLENHATAQKLQELQQSAAELNQQKIELEQMQAALTADRAQLTEELQRNNIKVISLMEELHQKDKEKEQVLDEKKELEQRLTSEMQLLENQLKASQSLLESVEGEKCEAVQKFHDQQEVVAGLTKDRNERQQRQETLQIERDQLSEDVQKQLSDLMEELQQKTNEREKVLREKKELEQRLSSEMKQLEERLKASESALESVKLENCIGTQRLQEVEDSASNLTQLIAELEQEQTTMKTERDQLSEEIERNVSHISSLVEELQQTSNEKEQIIRDKKEIEHRLSSEVQLLEERLKSCETTVKTVEGEKCNCIQKLKDLQESLAFLLLEKKELQQIQETLKSERGQLGDDFQKLSFLMEHLQRKIIEQEHHLGEGEGQASQTLVSDVQLLEEQLHTTVSALQYVKEENAKVLQKLQELQKELAAESLERDQLNQEKEALLAERDQLKEDIKENVKICIETQVELRKRQEDLTQQKELETELRNNIAELLICIEENSDKIQTAESLEIKLSSLMEELQHKITEEKQLLGEREELMQAKKTLVSEMQHIEQKLSASVSELEFAKGENSEAAKKLQELQNEVTSLSLERDVIFQAKEALKAEQDQLKEDIKENVELSIVTQDELRKTQEDLKRQKKLEVELRNKIAELSICIQEKSDKIQSTENLEIMLSSMKEAMLQETKAKEQLFVEREQLMQAHQKLTARVQQLEDQLKTSESLMETLKGDNNPELTKLKVEIKLVTLERDELQLIKEALCAESDELKNKMQNNTAMSVEAEEALRRAQEELKQQKCLVDELQNQVEAYSFSIQEKSVALQTASSLEEKLMIELKTAKAEVLLVQQKLEELNTLLAEKESRVSGLLNPLSSQDHLLNQHSQELRAEIKRNKDFSEQVVLLEEEIAALRTERTKPASSKTDSEIARHIAILEDRNKQFKVLLEKSSCMFTEYTTYLDKFSQDLHKESISQKELLDVVNASLASTLSRPFERLKADNTKLNSQIQTVVNKLKFVCNTKVMDDQYALINNFQMDLSNEKKKQIDLELQCAQKYGSSWEATSEQLKRKELQCLDEFIQKSMLIQQLELDLSEIEKGIESVLPDLQQEVKARKEFMDWLHSCSEITFDATKLNAGLQEENKRLVQFILLQNEKLKTFGKFKTIKAKDYSKLCNELLQEKKENNKELLTTLHSDVPSAGGHIAVEENQRLFNKLHAAQEEIKKSQIKIQNLERELNGAQHDAKENEKKASSLEKQLAFELNKLKTKLGDREQNLKTALSEVQALQVKLETGSKPYMEEIDQLKTHLVKMSMEKTKLSKYTDQEIAFLKSSVEDKEEQLRKLREQLRRAHQDQDTTVVVEKHTSEPSNVVLTCGGGSGIVQSTAVLIMKQEKANLERELAQQKKKYERLLRNEAQLKEENQKLKEAARKYLISPEAEALQKPLPTPAGKPDAPVENKDHVLSKCQESTTQETIILDSPKSSIFDPRSKALPLPRPTQFFDNSSFGTISDARPAETVPEKDPNDECWFAPSKSEKTQECRPS